jgi:hypothetical protein
LDNVRFEVLDITDLQLNSLPGKFDLITAVTAFHEILDFPGSDNSKPAAKLLKEYKESVSVDVINHLPEILSPFTGVFLSLERWVSLRSFGWWACALQNAGLFLNFNESSQVRFKQLLNDEYAQYPVLWCENGNERAEQSLDDTVSYWLLSKYREDLEKFRTFHSHNDLAEAAFLSINPKIFRHGARAVYASFLIRRMEIWQAGSFLLFFQFDTQGSRTLEVLPSIFYERLTERLNSLAEGLRASCDIEFYAAPEVQWD